MHWKKFTSIITLFLLTGCTLPAVIGQTTITPVGGVEEASSPEMDELTVEPQTTSTPNITLVVSETVTMTATLASSPTIPIALTPTIPLQPILETPSYIVQPGTPAWLPNFSHPEEDCNYQAVAGQVFDLDGLPVQNLVIEVKGQFDGEEIDLLTLTGVTPIYGPGGYELVISNHLVNSSDSLYLQIFDLTGRKISHQVYFDTFADCSKNLVLINFSQVNLDLIDQYHYFPFIYHNSLLQSMTPTPVP